MLLSLGRVSNSSKRMAHLVSNLIDRSRRAFVTEAVRVRRNWLWFTPGLLFFALGAAVLLMPALVLGLLAGFLVMVGVGFCVVAIKLVKLRGRLEEIASQLRSAGSSPAVIQGTIILGDKNQRAGMTGSRMERQTEFIEVGNINEKSKIVIH